MNNQQLQILKKLDKSIKMAEAISILNNKELSEQEKYNKLWDMIIKEIMKQISENSRGY
jgi:hypothetical protein